MPRADRLHPSQAACSAVTVPFPAVCLRGHCESLGAQAPTVQVLSEDMGPLKREEKVPVSDSLLVVYLGQQIALRVCESHIRPVACSSH